MTAEEQAAAEVAPPAGASRIDKAKKTAIFQRYCHVYRGGELEGLFDGLVAKGWVELEDVYYDTGNWCV